MHTKLIVESLLNSPEPAIRFKVRTGYLGEDPNAKSIRSLRKEIQHSSLVTSLLRGRAADGRIAGNVYAKWQGAHWIMATLADLGYPPGDKNLLPIRDQLQEHWLSEQFYKEFVAQTKAQAYNQEGVPVMQGRHRRCASQQANALWSILRLGLANQRTNNFVERLLHWQWTDGGWNCDKDPRAIHSSFMESLLPMRALAYFGALHSNEAAQKAARKAAEIFLKRQLFKRQADGSVIHAEFVQLHYPLYWHYDVLHALKVMVECGFSQDKRCKPAFELLLEKQLADGGWPAEKKYYKVSQRVALGNDYIDWGGTSKQKSNPWVTVDALHVLKAGGYIQ